MLGRVAQDALSLSADEFAVVRGAGDAVIWHLTQFFSPRRWSESEKLGAGRMWGRRRDDSIPVEWDNDNFIRQDFARGTGLQQVTA